MTIKSRPVRDGDLKQIYEWRNNPLVRKNSFQTDEIKWEEHFSYWTKRMQNTDCYSYIVLLDQTDLGLIRIDKKNNSSYEVNILIAPESQGKGYGIMAIDKTKKIAIKLKIKKLMARVKPDNFASQKIFEKNGFIEKERNKEVIYYYLLLD